MSQSVGRRRLTWLGVFLFCLCCLWIYINRSMLFEPFLEKTPPPVPPALQMEGRGEPQMGGETAPGRILASYTFPDQSALNLWEQKVFKGGTQYRVQTEGGTPFLRCLSENSASGLFMKTAIAAEPEVELRWRWRAHDFPVKKAPMTLSSRAEDDFAARIYVIFLASNLFRSDAIEYIWDERLPVESSADSAYSDRIKLLVIRSGPMSDQSVWAEEIRNPLADYRRLFGKDPKHPIGILAFMSDSDNTGSRASADLEKIELVRKG